MIWKEKTTGRLWYGGSIMLAGRRVFNPTEKQLEAAGYELFTPPVHEPGLEGIRLQKLAEIDAYDASEAVNSFELDGASVWLDYDMRQRTRTKIQAAELAGKETVTLWFDTVRFDLPCSLATRLIWIVEDYASECYDVTAQHKASVASFTTEEEIEAYDFRTGYPARPTINTKSAGDE